jgi:RNA polymerase sigma-70 factor (ECF subfamily)
MPAKLTETALSIHYSHVCGAPVFPQMTPSATPPAPPTPIAESIDSACLRAWVDGDRSAFASLVTRWQSRLINFFYRAVGNRADAEDLAQETFVDLSRAAARYTDQGSFSAFIFTLARRRLIDRYRKLSRRPLEYIDPSDFVMTQQPATADHSREIEEAFHRALAELPERQRTAILLLQQQGLSYDEIATALDASVSAVKTWIHRARTQLRSALKEYSPTHRT